MCSDLNLLGLGGLAHDGNCCLLDAAGRPLFIGEEERYTRIKRHGSLAQDALEFLRRQRRFAAPIHTLAISRKDGLPKVDRDYLQTRFPGAEIVWIDHHLAHAASAFYASSFQEAAILTLDGSGDGCCGMLATGRGSRIAPLARVPAQHSLGMLWMRTGGFLGFAQDRFLSGAKVMALAAYGQPKYTDVFLDRFLLHADGTYEIRPGKVPAESLTGAAHMGQPFFLEKALGLPPRQPGARILRVHRDVAASMQRASEEVVLHMVRSLQKRTGLKNLCLAGGVALNCTQNGRLLRDGPFDKVFVVPNASDCGDGMGAALYHAHHNLGQPRHWFMHMPYLGAGYTRAAMAAALNAAGVAYTTPADIATTAAKAIARGAVIGWFQGRAEAGPRALGNRSILADPRRSDIRDYMNHAIKHREWFRPFAPSVLAEHAADYFCCTGSLPYMLFAVSAHAAKAGEIPGVLHVDGTARVQTVRRKDNPMYRRLLSAFFEETGIPMLLNTSFNDRGEPIVNAPSEAVHRFKNSKLDALALGPFWVEKT